MASLLEVDQHFAFGENWQSFAKLLDNKRIEEAEAGMTRLFPNGELDGATFLDVGCGSGLSSLAATRLGVARIDAVDLDPNSVAATTEMLSTYAKDIPWTARIKSVFDLNPAEQNQYDIVYSWGVLHHTGDMWRAVKYAALMVKPGGYFAIALYRKTPSCDFWTREKQFYSRAPRLIQTLLRTVYMTAFLARTLRHGESPIAHIRNYHSARGMSWFHDVHDWLGGYPYESASAESVRAFLEKLGFKIVREFVGEVGNGIWGSGCDEYVAVRDEIA